MRPRFESHDWLLIAAPLAFVGSILALPLRAADAPKMPAPKESATLEIPAEVKSDPGKWLVLSPKTNAKSVVYVGLDALEPFPSAELKDPRKLVVHLPAVAGRWRFVAVGTLNDEQVTAAFVIIVGDAPPTPPGPGPQPPGPGPNPPTPVKGLKVLIIEESADRTKLTTGQLGMIFGKAFRGLLDSKTPVGPDGKTREWRIYDKDTDASAESKLWQDWLKRPRTALPWIILGNESGVAFEGPLPATAAEGTALINKYAPQSRGKVLHHKTRIKFHLRPVAYRTAIAA